MKSETSEFRIVLKDNPGLTEEFSGLRAGDKDVELLIKVQVNNVDEFEISGTIDGAGLESAAREKEPAHNAVAVIGAKESPPPGSTEVEKSEINMADML